MRVLDKLRMLTLLFTVLLLLNSCGSSKDSNDLKESVSASSVKLAEQNTEYNETNDNKFVTQKKIEFTIKDSKQVQEAIRSLSADLFQLTKVLERDILLFHWTKCSAIKNQSDIISQKKDAVTLMKDIINQAWDFKNNKNTEYLKLAAGLGLYLARDPWISSSFGKCLIQIKIPKGTHYLDVTKRFTDVIINPILISNKTKIILKDIGCSKIDVDNYGGDTVFEHTNNNLLSKQYLLQRVALYNPVCNQIIMASLKSLNISMINHAWLEVMGKHLKDCKVGDGGTFVLIDADLVTMSSVVLQNYENIIKEGIESLGEDEKKLLDYTRLIEVFEYTHLGETSVYAPSDQERLEKWKKENIYKCGDYASEADLVIDDIKVKNEDLKYFNNLPSCVFQLNDRCTYKDKELDDYIVNKMRIHYKK